DGVGRLERRGELEDDRVEHRAPLRGSADGKPPMRLDQPTRGECSNRPRGRAQAADGGEATKVDPFGQAHSHQQGLVCLLLAGKPCLAVATRAAHCSGWCSVLVASRCPATTMRPCAPGPMPAYSP